MTTSIRAKSAEIEANMARVILGKPDVIRYCLVALLSGEHLLLEDVPGVGKTLAGKAIAKSVDGRFARLQFTPDLLPSDITGNSIFDARENRFEFHAGPIFNNIVLADEINRAPPRTQAALLEAMSDHQVSVDGQTHALPRPFLVIATQNPFEYEGTYVLPESQLDRFLLRISMGYPARDSERDVLMSHRHGEPVDTLGSVVDTDQIRELQEAVREIRVEASLVDYLLDIVERTRNSPDLNVGVSTRGALLWYRAVQAYAFAEGRDFAVPDDIKRLAVPVLGHRVLARGSVQGGQREAVEGIVARIVADTPTPV